jgi:BioD-like phosphotransacetylase family protein
MMVLTIGQLAQHLDAKWVMGEAHADLLVRHILIGGNIMDSGITYFGRHEDKAVVVRGDRPDIQLSALATPTVCLVLTGGHHPIPYVLNEAQQKNVALLVVPGDTAHTAELMDTMYQRSTIHHPRKVDRFLHLIEEHGVKGTLESIFN